MCLLSLHNHTEGHPHLAVKPNFLLAMTDEHLELRFPNSHFQPLFVDFCSAKTLYRRFKGGGKGQLIAKAIGLKKHPGSTVIDATAGLGADSFALATLGCKVIMVERSDIVGALLQDGLNRLKTSGGSPIDLSLVRADAITYLNTLDTESLPDVVYLDPMFPLPVKDNMGKNNVAKSALAKKEMRILRALVGDDNDAPALFQAALNCAQKRVVVKRHRLAPTLTQQLPDMTLTGKSSRFDIYFKVSLC
jgi:16S rRNA (guanine1516-N2)-methyltransferase